MNETLQQFLQISIVGVALSGVVQAIKRKWGPEAGMTKLITIFLAIMFGAAYYFFVGTQIWVAMIGILAAASTFYALFINVKK